MERQTVRARGLRFAVFTSPPISGSASALPLLCVNGGMLYDHSMLWPALAPLALRRQVILYDQRGRGLSDAPLDVDSASIDDDAADLGALRRALGVRQWDLLGHSWGGGIALLGASLDQGGVRSAVTVDAVGPTSDWMPAVRAAALSRLEGDGQAVLARFDELTLGQADPELHAAHSRAVYPAWFVDAELGRSFTPPKATSQTGAVILARLRRDGYDWRDRLRALSIPTLVIHGEQDALPVSVSADWVTVLPKARRALIPHSGHMPFWEAPEQFFSLVDSFLAAPQSGDAGRTV